MFAQVGKPSKRVDERAETFFVEADSHSVDGEIAAVLVVFERAFFYYGVAAVVSVRLAAGSYYLYLRVAMFYLCRAVGLEHCKVSSSSQMPPKCLGESYAVAYYYYVYVFRWAAEQQVSHITTYKIAFHTF